MLYWVRILENIFKSNDSHHYYCHGRKWQIQFPMEIKFAKLSLTKISIVMTLRRRRCVFLRMRRVSGSTMVR